MEDSFFDSEFHDNKLKDVLQGSTNIVFEKVIQFPYSMIISLYVCRQIVT